MGTNYTIALATPINVADRVTFTISNADITTFTRRLDVLPGDVNDHGMVTIQDAAQIHNDYLGFAPVTVAIVFLDFASVNTTTAPYVFSTLQTAPLIFATFPTANSFVASDSYASFPGWVAVLAGQTVGLEHVTYSVASGTHAEAVTVSISSLGTTTAILDQDDSVMTSSAINGSISIGGASVPEPSSMLLGVIAAVSLITVRRIWSTGGLAPSPR